MRFAFIAAKKAEHRVTILCRCMRVTRSGFYAWARRGLSARAQRDLVLRTKLRAFHAASGDRYGRPRLWKDLREDGEAISEKRVRRLMRDEQIQGRVPKRFKQTTNSDHDDPIAPNVLARDFTAAAPNQRWVSDTTEFVIGDGAKVYLAAILDLFSRFVVGWAISAVNDRRLDVEGPRDGSPAARSRSGAPASLRPWLHVHVRGLPNVSRGPWHYVQHESARRLLRQCGDRKLVRHGEEGGGRPVSELQRREDGVVRLYRGVL